MKIKSPFEGNRIALRPFEPDDVPELQVYLNHPDLVGRRYIPWAFSDWLPLSRKQVEEIYEKWIGAEKKSFLAILLRETRELIGHGSFDWRWDPHCPSVSLVIAPMHQRQGYGSEVLGLLLRYLFQHTPAHNVSGWMADWNEPARRFVAHHGFQESGRMRRIGMREGKDYDLITADLLRPEWLARQGGGEHGA